MSFQNESPKFANDMALDEFAFRYDPYEPTMPLQNQGDSLTWPSELPNLNDSLQVGEHDFGINDMTWPAAIPAWQPAPMYSMYPEEPLLPVSMQSYIPPYYNGYPIGYSQQLQAPMQPIDAPAQLTSLRPENPTGQDSDTVSTASTSRLPPRRAPIMRRRAKVQKRKAVPAANPGVVISEPLSSLAKDNSTVEAEIEAFVNRGTEERLKEHSGYRDRRVRRPLNAFMLYRKAYQGPAKQWGDEKNHQHISKTCGASWRIETPEVRARFAAFSIIELENHRVAFPSYKYSPRKYPEGTALDFDDYE